MNGVPRVPWTTRDALNADLIRPFLSFIWERQEAWLEDPSEWIFRFHHFPKARGGESMVAIYDSDFITDYIDSQGKYLDDDSIVPIPVLKSKSRGKSRPKSSPSPAANFNV